MRKSADINPANAFQYLHDKQLPLIVSFSLEERKSHFVTAKGICWVEKIHGSSRISFSRFSPARLLNSIRLVEAIYATFDMGGKTYGCILTDLTVTGGSVTASLPDSLSPYLRRFIRVEPSAKAPVVVHIRPMQAGTISFTARDIAEGGIGLISPFQMNLQEKIICGIDLPLEDRAVILTEARVVYKSDIARKSLPESSRTDFCGVAYGIELFPHQEDAKKIRMYVMQREVEIRKFLLER